MGTISFVGEDSVSRSSHVLERDRVIVQARAQARGCLFSWQVPFMFWNYDGFTGLIIVS